MKKVLLTLVGFNPASAIVSARAIKPDRTVLIHTPETEFVAEIVRKQIGGSCRLICLLGGAGIIQIVDDLTRELQIEVDELPVADITGATKPISLGLWQYLLTRFSGSFEAVNVSQTDYQLRNALSGEKIVADPVKIKANEILAWYGGRVKKTKWNNVLSEIPNVYLQRMSLYEGLLKALKNNQYKNLTYNGENAISVPRAYLPDELPEKFSYRKSALQTTITSYLGYNVWLEEYSLCLAAEALKQYDSNILAAMSMDLVVEKDLGAQDELDVVLVHGARTLVIEAKARQSSTGAGADLQKRIQKVQRFFGNHAKIIMFHPAWGDNAPKGLVNLTGNSAELVGANIDHFKEAVRRGLELN